MGHLKVGVWQLKELYDATLGLQLVHMIRLNSFIYHEFAV